MIYCHFSLPSCAHWREFEVKSVWLRFVDDLSIDQLSVSGVFFLSVSFTCWHVEKMLLLSIIQSILLATNQVDKRIFFFTEACRTFERLFTTIWRRYIRCVCFKWRLSFQTSLDSNTIIPGSTCLFRMISRLSNARRYIQVRILFFIILA